MVDEAHVTEKWSVFRKHYGLVGELRSIIPDAKVLVIPFLVFGY